MTKVYVTINKFHEKKRRIEYAAIKRKLNIPDEDTVQYFNNYFFHQLEITKKEIETQAK